MVVPNQNMNALTLRSLIEKEKLSTWIILKYEGKLTLIETLLPDPPGADMMLMHIRLKLIKLYLASKKRLLC